VTALQLPTITVHWKPGCDCFGDPATRWASMEVPAGQDIPRPTCPRCDTGWVSPSFVVITTEG
jgi:hypothetical protein